MKNSFRDLFSDGSEQYAEFRPHYPDELFSFLSDSSIQHQLAWDCATGSGQSATKLTHYFNRVIATDASQSQINNANKVDSISYRVATAENSGINANSVDLITVAQALHWFDLETFAKEVNRVLKNEGLLAVWTYNLLSIRQDIDELVNHLYQTILKDCWFAERALVEDGYRDIQFPFEALSTPEFYMYSRWNLPQLVGYLNTWSAVRKYHKKFGANPVELIYPKLLKTWCEPTESFPVTWPLSLRVWKKSTIYRK